MYVNGLLFNEYKVIFLSKLILNSNNILINNTVIERLLQIKDLLLGIKQHFMHYYIMLITLIYNSLVKSRLIYGSTYVESTSKSWYK